MFDRYDRWITTHDMRLYVAILTGIALFRTTQAHSRCLYQAYAE